ncbi:MAG: hypothetical protein ACOVQT_05030, partial [Rubrivivax sp.]
MKDFFETGLETTAPVADHRTPRRLALLDDIDRALGHAVGLVGTARHERGKVRLAVGTLVRASGVRAEVGEICRLVDPGGGGEQRAEVIGFDGDEVLMSPMGGLDGLSGSTQVIATGQRHAVAVGDFLLGRVVDGLGERFLDQGPPAPADAMRLSVSTGAPPPLSRRPIEHALPSGVNAIDGVLTCGVGQRMGIFAPAGCGKSTLLSMLCRNAEVDVVVAALVGERGREVQDFIDDAL